MDWPAGSGGRGGVISHFILSKIVVLALVGQSKKHKRRKLNKIGKHKKLNITRSYYHLTYTLKMKPAHIRREMTEDRFTVCKVSEKVVVSSCFRC